MSTLLNDNCFSWPNVEVEKNSTFFNILLHHLECKILK